MQGKLSDHSERCSCQASFNIGSTPILVSFVFYSLLDQHNAPPSPPRYREINGHMFTAAVGGLAGFGIIKKFIQL